ncbi:MAG: tail fiber domain-containing protein [Niabella sp.]|nr:tail fiber domain-containing protein [Niabella sp.]
MKLKLFLSALAATCLSITAIAQVPQQFAFQGVARNSNGQPVANQKVSVRFTIHQGAEVGGQVFQETHSPTTNAAGVFNVAIGSKTAFPNTLNWSNNVAYYLQVEIDPAGGSAYTTISTSQLLSVPYAIAASRLVAAGSTVLSTTGTTMGSSGNKALGANATAMGWITTASGDDATAMGSGTTASGKHSVAMGIGSVASGFSAFAMGSTSKATNNNTFAMGYSAEATGYDATAIGGDAKASGDGAIAIGGNAEASGNGAQAFGTWAYATGDNSTAIGNYVNTGSKKGSFIIGDYRTSGMSNDAANQMIMRFGGGYRFYTGSTGTGGNIGVMLFPDGNSWSAISDSTKKENYRQPDGIAFLSKIRGMKIGSWNYKGQDKQLHRHYGPMAQEFYSLFGHDGVGTIGNDTTIASADIDGVIMIALQALVKQADQLSEANKKLQQRVQQLEAARKEH